MGLLHCHRGLSKKETVYVHAEIKNKLTFANNFVSLFFTCKRKKYTLLFTWYFGLHDYWISLKGYLRKQC